MIENNNQDSMSIWQTNPKLKSLLVVFISFAFIVGVALIYFVRAEKEYKEAQDLMLINGGPLQGNAKSRLPVYTPPQEQITWKQTGQKIELEGFNNPSFELPNGWYWSDLRVEDGYPGTKVFSAVASNYLDAKEYTKGDHPKDFKWFTVNIWPAGNAYKNSGIQQYADKHEDFVLSNGTATLYEILKAKPGTEDMVLPVYSGLAFGDQPGYDMAYEVVVMHGTDGFPKVNSELKNAMVALLKSVKFEIAWVTYRNEEYGFEFEYPAELEVGKAQQSINLGTYNNPAEGFSVGLGTIVVLKNQALKEEALGIVERLLKESQNPPSEADKQAGLYVECFKRDVVNVNTVIKAVNCGGEGGPAYFAYIKGQNFDVFYDGFGRDVFSKTADKMFSTFKFTK